MTRQPSWPQRLWAFIRRRLLLWIVLIGFTILVITQFTTLRMLAATLVRGQFQWLIAAALLQVVYYLVYSFQYKLGFATVEVQSRVVELVPVLFASIFLKAVVPSGGVAGLAVFVDDATRRGQSAARAAEGALLVLVADLTTMVPLIAYGIYYLSIGGVLEAYQWIASTLFVLFVGALAGFLVLGKFQPARLHRLFQWAQDRINYIATSVFKRPPLLPPEWAIGQATEYCGAACDIAEHPVPLARTLGIAFAAHVVNVASLYSVSIAYRAPLPIGAMVAAFAMDIVFSVINIIPHGLGVAEGIIALVLVSLGVPSTSALAIAIVFRGLNVWLPLAIGFFFINRVPSLGARQG